MVSTADRLGVPLLDEPTLEHDGPLGGERVQVAGAQVPEQQLAVGHQAEVVGRGVALVDAERVGAVLGADRPQPVADQIERGVPGHLAPARAVLHQRVAQAIGIVVEIGERGGLGAQVAARERIGGVAPHRGHLRPLHVDRDATGSLAQGTAAIMRHGHGVLRPAV